MIPLRLDISVVGTANVKKALSSIERDIVRSNARMARSAGVPSRGRSGASGANADAALAAQNRKRLKDIQAQQTRNRKFEQANIKAIQAMQAQQHAARMAQLKKEKAEEAAKARAAASLDRQRSAALTSQFLKQQSLEKQQTREAVRRARAEQQARHRFARGVGFTAGQSVTRGLSAVGRAGLTAATIGGGLLLHSAIGTELTETKLAGQLAAQTGQVGVKKQLLREARQVKGFTGAEALGGMMSFVDITGDLDIARGIIQEMGDTALSTNTDISEMGSAVGSAFIAISDKIKDPQKRIEALKNVMRQMAGAGAIGAVEVKDLAKEMAGLAGASQFFAGDPEENLKMMNAIAQTSRQRGGSKSAAEAAMSVQRLSTDLLNRTKQKRLRGLGIDIFSDESRTALKDPREIMLDVLAKTKGDLTKVAPVFNERSLRAFKGIQPVWTEAEKKKKGSGRQAVLDEFQRFLDAQLTDEDIAIRKKSRLEDPDMVFKEAMKEFNHAIGAQLLPVLVEMIPKFTALIPTLVDVAEAFGKFLDFAANNPWEGLGLIVGAAIAKEIALAGIGKIVGGAVTSTLMQTTMGGAGGAGLAVTRAGGGLVGTAAGAAGAGAAAARAGKAAKAARFLGLSRGMGAAGLMAAATGTLVAGAAAAGGAYLAADQATKASDEGAFEFLLSGGKDNLANWRAKREAQRRRTEKRRAGADALRLYSGDGVGVLEEAFKTTHLMQNTDKLSDEGRRSLAQAELDNRQKYTSFMPLIDQPRLDSLEHQKQTRAKLNQEAATKTDPSGPLKEAAAASSESAGKLGQAAERLSAAADRLQAPRNNTEPSFLF